MQAIVNLEDYMKLALGTAIYERQPGGPYHGTIPSLPDVWAEADTLDECHTHLRDVLEDWLRQRLATDLDVPAINGSLPLVSTSYCPWQA